MTKYYEQPKCPYIATWEIKIVAHLDYGIFLKLLKVWRIHYILIWEHIKEIFKWKGQVAEQIIQYDYRYIGETDICVYVYLGRVWKVMQQTSKITSKEGSATSERMWFEASWMESFKFYSNTSVLYYFTEIMYSSPSQLFG